MIDTTYTATSARSRPEILRALDLCARSFARPRGYDAVAIGSSPFVPGTVSIEGIRDGMPLETLTIDAVPDPASIEIPAQMARTFEYGALADHRVSVVEDMLVVSDRSGDEALHDIEAFCPEPESTTSIDAPTVDAAQWGRILDTLAGLDLETLPGSDVEPPRIHCAAEDGAVELDHAFSLRGAELADTSVIDAFIDDFETIGDMMIDVHTDPSGTIRTATVSHLDFDPATQSAARSIRGLRRLAASPARELDPGQDRYAA